MNVLSEQEKKKILSRFKPNKTFLLCHLINDTTMLSLFLNSFSDTYMLFWSSTNTLYLLDKYRVAEGIMGGWYEII